MPGGDYPWIRAFGGTERVRSVAVAADDQANVFVTGQFQGVAELENS